MFPAEKRLDGESWRAETFILAGGARAMNVGVSGTNPNVAAPSNPGVAVLGAHHNLCRLRPPARINPNSDAPSNPGVAVRTDRTW